MLFLHWLYIVLLRVLQRNRTNYLYIFKAHLCLSTYYFLWPTNTPLCRYTTFCSFTWGREGGSVEIYYRNWLVWYGGQEVPGSAIWRMENSGSWRCNSAQVRGPEDWGADGASPALSPKARWCSRAGEDGRLSSSRGQICPSAFLFYSGQRLGDVHQHWWGQSLPIQTLTSVQRQPHRYTLK